MEKIYKIKKTDKEHIDYVNVSSSTPDKLGRKLSYVSTFNPINTLIGKITCLRTAMSFIVTPGYPERLLSKTKLSSKDINKIPKETVFVPNYIAIVTHLVFERILNDKPLLDELLELPKDIKFTSFNIKNNFVSGFDSKLTLYSDIPALLKYLQVIENIFKIIKNNDRKDWSDLVCELIIESKADKDKKLFADVPFEIEFDESQLEKKN